MRKEVNVNFLLIFLFVLLSVSFVSAGVFSDFFNKITGRVADSTPTKVSLNSFNAPLEYSGGSCVKAPVLVTSGLKKDNLITINDLSGSICARFYPRKGKCVTDSKQACKDLGKSSLTKCNNTIVKAGFYDTKTSKKPKLIKEYSLVELQKGIATPDKADSLYVYVKETNKGNYFDNNGAFSCEFNWNAQTCTPDCSNGKTCGDDGCGKSCGTCKDNQECSSAGKCTDIVKDVCTDSDGGKNYDVKGTAKYGTSEKTDGCYNSTRVREFFCVDVKMDANNIGDEGYDCPNGCSDGACKNETNPDYSCTDSDGGKEYYIKGRIVGTIGSGSGYDDYCINKSVLLERHCLGSNTDFSETYLCPNGCSDGACVSQGNQNCTDSDGGKNYDVKGTCIDSLEGTFVDYCNENNKLVEYKCTSDKGSCVFADSSSYNCPNGCSDGACTSSNISYSYTIYDSETKTIKGRKISVAVESAERITLTVDDASETGTEGDKGVLNGLYLYIKNVVAPNVAGTERYVELEIYNEYDNSVIILDGSGYYKDGRKIYASIEDSNSVTLTVDGTSESHDEGWNGRINGLAIEIKNVVAPNVAGTERYVELVLGSCREDDGGKNKYVKGKTCVGESCKVDTCTKATAQYDRDKVKENYCSYDYINEEDMYCAEGCLDDGACKKTEPVTNEVCQNLIDVVANPEDVMLGGFKFNAGSWNDHYKGSYYIDNQEYKYDEYSGNWNAYNSYESGSDKENKEYKYENAYIYANVVVFEDINIDLSSWLKDKTAYRICTVESMWDFNDKENVVYICTWDVLNKRQTSENYEYNSVQVLWYKNNVFVEMNIYSGKSLTNDEVKKIADKRINDFLNDLKDNQNKYIGWENYDLTYLGRNLVMLGLKYCDSEVSRPTREDNQSQTCTPSWSCKLEPATCPEYGYQTRICVDYGCDQEKREEQMYCSPGICSGCYVPRWLGYENGDNICVTYGTRLSSIEKTQTGKIYEGTEYEGPKDKNHLEFTLNMEEDSPKLSIYEIIDGDSNTIFDQNLYKGSTYDIDLGKYGREKIKFRVKNIVKASEDEKGYVEIDMLNNFNAYCNYNGKIMKQKTIGETGDWAKCQNHYECESNFCSSGECIEITKMLDEASSYKTLGIKILCRFANLFNIEKYNQCIDSRL